MQLWTSTPLAKYSGVSETVRLYTARRSVCATTRSTYTGASSCSKELVDSERRPANNAGAIFIIDATGATPCRLAFVGAEPRVFTEREIGVLATALLAFALNRYTAFPCTFAMLTMPLAASIGPMPLGGSIPNLFELGELAIRWWLVPVIAEMIASREAFQILDVVVVRVAVNVVDVVTIGDRPEMVSPNLTMQR